MRRMPTDRKDFVNIRKRIRQEYDGRRDEWGVEKKG